MTDMKMTASLELHWVSVTAPDGRTHLEARWAEASARPHAQAA